MAKKWQQKSLTVKEFIAQARQLDFRSFEYIFGIIKELNTKR